jgi:hypothetical protein
MSQDQAEKVGRQRRGEEARPTASRVSTNDVVKNIQGGVYKIVYDQAGLQHADSSNSNPDSTWYHFDIMNTAGQKVGYFHVHPDDRKKCGYASGNLRMFNASAASAQGRDQIIGRALDWQYLCDAIVGQIK